LVSIWRLNASGASASNRPGSTMPAEVIRMSHGPKWSSHRPIAAAVRISSATSTLSMRTE